MTTQTVAKLSDFKAMWERDGTRLVEQERRVVDGCTWLLYAVYFPSSTSEYGRHMAMILKVDTKTQEILMHDLRNIQGEARGAWHQGIDQWFREHVGRY